MPFPDGISISPTATPSAPADSEPLTPFVGCIVHYHSYGTPGGEYQPEPRAAVVTTVLGGQAGAVGLCVLNPTGLFFNQNVPYSKSPRPGHWSWSAD